MMMRINRFQKDIISLFLISIVCIFKKRHNSEFNNVKTITGKVLLVTAHPDDETMFFTPLLQQLSNDNITILCLSKVNSCREKEMKNLCKRYKYNLIHTNRFVDNNDWCIDDIKNLIIFIDILYNFDVIYTFDENGVSNHKNHKSCFYGVKEFLKNSLTPCPVYCLDSLNIFNKYITHNLFFTKEYKFNMKFKSTDYLDALYRMSFHFSQLLWYRILYLLFSSYMKYNTFTQLVLD